MAAKVRKNKQKAKTFLPKKYRIKRGRDKLIFIRIQSKYKELMRLNT